MPFTHSFKMLSKESPLVLILRLQKDSSTIKLLPDSTSAEDICEPPISIPSINLLECLNILLYKKNYVFLMSIE